MSAPTDSLPRAWHKATAESLVPPWVVSHARRDLVAAIACALVRAEARGRSGRTAGDPPWQGEPIVYALDGEEPV